MANFTAGTSFSDGVTNDVTAAKLNALVADAVPTSNLSLNSTTGTIATFNSTTPTFLGAITASTNTINVGSGQIFKDASGNVGVGTASPTALRTKNLEVSSSAVNDGAAIIATKRGTGVATMALTTVGAADGFHVNYNFPSTGMLSFFDIASNTERMVINSSGQVGIGTTSPSSKLTVGSGDIVISDNFGIGAGGGAQGIYNGTSQFVRFDTASTERVRIDASGGVTIAGLAGSGSRAVNASAAGLLSAASDASLKEEVVGAHIAGLNEILQIHPKMYRWKDDIANRGDEASVELGFIANDVAPIIPSAAPMGNDGLYGFYDRSITAALVKAVQELKAENDSLKSRIEALEAK